MPDKWPLKRRSHEQSSILRLLKSKVGGGGWHTRPRQRDEGTVQCAIEILQCTGEPGQDSFISTTLKKWAPHH